MQKLKLLQQKKAQETDIKKEEVSGSSASSSPSPSTSDAPTANAPLKQDSKNVFSLKSKTKQPSKKTTRQNAAELRAQKDVSEMDHIPGAKIVFPNADEIMKFEVQIKPTDGLYQGATFNFVVDIPNSYPYDPPKVLCTTLVYHPNIDWDGKVCLNILRQDWMPVLSLGSVVFGLMTLFLEPNADDPLNKEAAQLMLDRIREFERNVKESLRGGTVGGRRFPKLL